MTFPSLDIDTDKLRAEMMAPNLCAHGSSELRRKLDKNGCARLHTQCLDCGLSVGPRVSIKTLKREDIDLLPLFDEELPRKQWADFQARFEKAEKQKKEQLKQQWKDCYEEYLRSPEWRSKRILVFKRAGGQCEGCMRRSADEVHHTTYDNVGEEFLFQLVALCQDCHKRLHSSTMPALLERLWEWDFYRKMNINKWS